MRKRFWVHLPPEKVAGLPWFRADEVVIIVQCVDLPELRFVDSVSQAFAELSRTIARAAVPAFEEFGRAIRGLGVDHDEK